jgi:metallo-beta-lactamase family protein
VATRKIRIAAALVSVFLIVCAGGQVRASRGDVTVTLHGAAGGIGGALARVEFRERTWVVDCGAFQPDGEETAAPQAEKTAGRNNPLPSGATAAAGVLITHAHRDHMGRLPLLVHGGYVNPIYLTEATAAIAKVMLRAEILYDEQRERSWIWSARSVAKKRYTPAHWFPECEAARAITAENRRGRHCPLQSLKQSVKRPRPCRKCADLEVAGIARLFSIVSFGEAVALGPGITATFFPAGHIPGAASILLTCEAGSKKPYRLLFSGDLGNDLSTLTGGPVPAPPADVVFLEATYGIRLRAEGDETTEPFRRDLAEAVGAGRTVWIPAFSLDRTQKILHQIVLAQSRGEMDSAMNVASTSPMAAEITALYRRALAERRGWFRPELEGKPQAISPPALTATWSPRFLRDNPSRPCILITAAGMMESASGRSLLATLLPRSDVEIFLVGWHSPSSAGGQLQNGARDIAVAGKSVPRKARVRDYGCFSGHGDARDIDRWLAPVPKTAVLVLMHGDADALESRAEDLQGKDWKHVRTAREAEVLRFPLPE